MIEANLGSCVCERTKIGLFPSKTFSVNVLNFNLFRYSDFFRWVLTDWRFIGFTVARIRFFRYINITFVLGITVAEIIF